MADEVEAFSQPGEVARAELEGPKLGLEGITVDDSHEPDKQGRHELPLPESSAGGQRSFKSSEIFTGVQEVFLDHESDRYRLRLTSKGKLILTK